MYLSNRPNASQDGERADAQVLERTGRRLRPDVPMPPRKKQKQAPTRRSHRLSPSAASASGGGAGTHPPSAGSLPPSQQAAADAVYHGMLQALAPEDLDFVRNDKIQWPAIRSSTNKTGKPYDKPRKKGDWHTQRSRFIREVFLTMFLNSESDKDTLLDLMFNGVKYDWLLDTARVIRAVQARYKGNTRGKAFTLLFHLCEVKCGAYLAESSFDEAFEQAKMVYVDMQKTPDEPPPADSAHMMAILGCITVVLAGYLISPSTALAAAAVYSAVARARLMKQRAHTALDMGDYMYEGARSLMVAARSLEVDGFVDNDEEPPPLFEETTNSVDLRDITGDELEIAILSAWDDNESIASTLTLPGSSSDDDEAPTDGLACDYSAGCPTKPYTGRDPTPDERRNWEAAATAYYQFLLKNYQNAIETLRLEVFTFLSQDNLDVSKFLGRKSALAKKTSLKKGLEQTRAYFAVATLYGEVGGSYEPERLDWCRAQFTTNFRTLPKSCMFVLVAEEQVTMILRDGNKNGQDVDQDLTAVAPGLAGMLRLWMPHAVSAQPNKSEPFVIFKTENESYGKGFDDSSAYGKAVTRAWVNKKGQSKLGDINPQYDADKEWIKEGEKKVAGLGCGWARTVTGRARRGVVCKEGEQRDDAAAAAQGHSATTERASYRAL